MPMEVFRKIGPKRLGTILRYQEGVMDEEDHQLLTLALQELMRRRHYMEVMDMEEGWVRNFRCVEEVSDE